jgi:hypothetical protein
MGSCRPFGIDPFLVSYTAEDEPNTGDVVSFLEIFLCNNASIRTSADGGKGRGGNGSSERPCRSYKRGLTIQELKGIGRSLLQDRISTLAMREDLLRK